MRNLTIAECVADLMLDFPCAPAELPDAHPHLTSLVASQLGETYGTERGADNLTRYVFTDGSAIVVDRVNDTWDVEGETPFSWKGK